MVIDKKKPYDPCNVGKQTRLSKGDPSETPITLGIEWEFISEDNEQIKKSEKITDRKKEKVWFFSTQASQFCPHF